jgi:hypothetical protein
MPRLFLVRRNTSPWDYYTEGKLSVGAATLKPLAAEARRVLEKGECMSGA